MSQEKACLKPHGDVEKLYVKKGAKQLPLDGKIVGTWKYAQVFSSQFSSSVLSPQSFSPSHFQALGMHRPLPHPNWRSSHVTFLQLFSSGKETTNDFQSLLFTTSLGGGILHQKGQVTPLSLQGAFFRLEKWLQLQPLKKTPPWSDRGSLRCLLSKEGARAGES